MCLCAYVCAACTVHVVVHCQLTLLLRRSTTCRSECSQNGCSQLVKTMLQLCSSNNTSRQIDRQTDRKTKQTDRNSEQKDRQTDRQTDRHNKLEPDAKGKYILLLFDVEIRSHNRAIKLHGTVQHMVQCSR